VRTGEATTRVLGTQFVVQRYGADSPLRVAVVEGKVFVTPETTARRSPVVLTAGYVGEISDSLTVVRKEANIATETGWLHDELAFNRVPVSEVLEALTRWYGYEFRLNDSILTHQRVRIALSTRSSPRALAALKQVLDVDLTFSGNTITLTRRNAHGAAPATRRSTYDVWTPSKEVGR
jgi:ferric-dicitrate binding protein FerR (iron transport regulator)